jgi:hypothetical protein
MSGGSYNYLCNRYLSNDTEDVERMAARLRELGHEDAAQRTEEVVGAMKLAASIQEELSDVWRAVEWIDSCDSSEGDERRAVEAWRAKRSGG